MNVHDAPALVADQNAMLKADRAMVVQQDARLESARRGTKPDFSVGYMFQLTGTSYRDYYVATFNVRFPRKKRVNAEIAEAAEMVARSRADADADQQQQVAEAQKESIAAKSSAELMKEYQQGLIPQAESVFQSELTAYQSNRGPLNAVLTALMPLRIGCRSGWFATFSILRICISPAKSLFSMAFRTSGS